MKVLVVIEKAGNKPPHPFWLFLSLAVIVMILSAIFSATGLNAVNPATGETVTVTNLFTTESLREIVGGAVMNFVTFPPLGLVIIVLLGVAVAEQSGLIPAMLRGTIAGASPRWITFIVALAGTASSIASDASYMIMIPLGGLAFRAVGRNPMLGRIVAYAATSGGYSAAPMVNAMDTVLGGLSTSAAQIIDPEYVVSPVANFYFNFISMFVVAGAITLVTELLLSKRADAMELDPLDEDDPEAFDVKMALDAKEKRGVLFAVITIVVCAAILFFLALPADSFLRDEAGGFGPESGLMAGIAAIIGFGFFIVGIVYGYATGSITKITEIPEMMGRACRLRPRHRPLLRRQPVPRPVQDVEPRRDPRDPRGGLLRLARHLDVRHPPRRVAPRRPRRSLPHLRLRSVDAHGPRPRPDVHAPVDLPGDDAGALPDRRFDDEHHLPDVALLRRRPRLHPALQARRRHRHAPVVHDPALVHDVPLLGPALLPLVVHRPPMGTRCGHALPDELTSPQREKVRNTAESPSVTITQRSVARPCGHSCHPGVTARLERDVRFARRPVCATRILRSKGSRP